MLPGVLTLVPLFVLPLGLVLVLSLTHQAPGGQGLVGPSLASWRRLMDPLFLRVFWRSALLAGATTALAAALALPTALAIHRLHGGWRLAALAGVVLPAWMNLLVKNFAWVVLLRREGVVNSVLLGLGVTSQPLPLLYHQGAVLVGLLHAQLPFMVLPLLASLQRLDPLRVDAARDLGASPLQVFRHVTLPALHGGLLSGAVLVFSTSLGAFTTPDLLGGTRATMVSNLLQVQVMEARDWPFAAAMAVGVLAVIGLALGLGRRLGATRGRP